jgi:hypothetical protein
MIERVVFHNYKVLKAAELSLRPFNLIAGPNGSGKTTLLRSLVYMAEQMRMAPREASLSTEESVACERDLRIEWRSGEERIVVYMPCGNENQTQQLEIRDVHGRLIPADRQRQIRAELSSVRMLALDADCLGRSWPKEGDREMGMFGEGFSRVLWKMSHDYPEGWVRWKEEVLGLLEEFVGIQLRENGDDVELWVETREGVMLKAEHLSQGTLTILALMSLPFLPGKPAVLCLEEVERGIHPRLLDEIRDVLYRLAYPQDYRLNYQPVQVIATTQSPCFLDLFQDHPEEVIFSSKESGAGTFMRLSEQAEIHELLQGCTIGNLWYTGVLGGVPWYR